MSKMIAITVTIVIALANSGSAFEEGHHVPIDGLDCRHPRSVRTGSLSKICGTPAADSGTNAEQQSALILMYSTKHTVKAYRCTRVESTFREICGVWSHSKIYEPPSIMEDAMVTQSECRRMALHATYVKEDKSMMPIPLNTRTQYQFVRHGKLAYSTNNVACTGATVMIHGEQTESILELVSVQLLVKEIEVSIDTDSALDLDQNIKLPKICAKESTCQVGLEAYVLEHPEQTCPLSVIRQHVYTRVPIVQDGKPYTALVSTDTKTFLTLGTKEYSPVGCRPTFTYYATEYADIKVVTADLALADLSNLQKHLEASNLNIELEVKITSSYLSYTLDSRLDTQLNNVGQKLCRMTQHTLETTELSPFHSDSLIRVRGDLVQELKCTTVTAQVRVGEARDGKCYADSIQAWISNQPVRIQAVTHLVLQPGEVEAVNCNSTYPPYFMAADGKTLLTARPEVRVENVTLQHLEEDYLHLGHSGPVEHENYGTEFIYTHEEIDQFNDLIHFSRVKTRVVDNLVTDYCANNPRCGGYSPSSEPPTPFNLEAIKDEVNPLNWFTAWTDKLARAGSLCSIAFMICCICLVIYRIYQTVVLACMHNFGMLNAIRTIMLPSPWRPDQMKTMHADNRTPSPPNYPSIFPPVDGQANTMPEMIPLQPYPQAPAVEHTGARQRLPPVLGTVPPALTYTGARPR